MTPALAVTGLTRRYGERAVVDGATFAVARGELLAVVGPSGAGKSTLARCAVRLDEPDAGTVTAAGVDVRALRGRALRAWRRTVCYVAQDGLASFDPRWTLGASVGEALVAHGIARGAAVAGRVAAAFAALDLPATLAARYPHEASAGQCQRAACARALVLDPAVLVLDEPVAALDEVARDRVLADLAARRAAGTAVVLIAHDLDVVTRHADRVAVLAEGRVVESGPSAQVLGAPQHAVTRALVAAHHALHVTP